MSVCRAIAAIVFLAYSMAGDDCLAAPTFAGLTTGSIQNGSVNEASGIAASRLNPNVLWVHEDSGNSAHVFAMTSAGTNLGAYAITDAMNNIVSNIDWEDMAVGPGPLPDKQYLYIGDIGDNNSARSSISVYRVLEPTVSDVVSQNSSLSAEKLTFSFPTSPTIHRDAESMFVDPLTRDIYFITKRNSTSRVYRAPYPQPTSGTTPLEFVTAFNDMLFLTAADISPDGNEIIVRSSLFSTGLLFTRPSGGTIAQAFATTPVSIPLNSESQGEAIGFDPFGWGYYTTSEGASAPISYYNRLPPPVTTVYWDSDGTAGGSYLTTGTGMGGSGTWNTTELKWYNGSTDVRWIGGNNAIFWGTVGTVTLAAPQSVNSLSFKTSGYQINASILTLAGSSVTVDSGATATINSVVSGSVGLVKNGVGTLTLTSPNNYTGGTTINAGTLLVNNASGSGSGNGSVLVNSGAVLGGTGTIKGDVTNSGTVAPGNSVGTLHLDTTYTQSATGVLALEIGATGNDVLAVAETATLGGTLAVQLVGGFIPEKGDAFDVITASGFGGTTFATPNLPPLNNGLVWNVFYGANAVTLTVTIPGDLNHDGEVDAADYVVWRKTEGTADGYDKWTAHFGQTEGMASDESPNANVPEPATVLPLLAIALAVLLRRRPVC